jgi:hypothetical protein
LIAQIRLRFKLHRLAVVAEVVKNSDEERRGFTFVIGEFNPFWLATTIIMPATMARRLP